MLVLASRVDEVFSAELVPKATEPGRSTAFLVLVAFLLTFLFIRTSARLIRDPNVTWWFGNVEAGGVHLHHMAFGITMILVSGFLAFAADLSSPWWHLAAIGYGIGAGLTIDEFALWLYVKDVYWEEQGRLSVDAAILATTFALLVVIGTKPFGLDEPVSVGVTVLLVAQALVLSTIAFLKAATCWARSPSSSRSGGCSPPFAWPSPARRGRAGSTRASAPTGCAAARSATVPTAARPAWPTAW